MGISKFVDTKSLILQVYKLKAISEISLTEYQKFLNKLYLELYNRSLLNEYQITFEVNSDYLEYMSVVYDNIFVFDKDYSVIYLKDKNEMGCLCNHNLIDDTLLSIIEIACNFL